MKVDQGFRMEYELAGSWTQGSWACPAIVFFGTVDIIYAA